MNPLECVLKKALEPQKSLRFERPDPPSADVTADCRNALEPD